VSADFAEDQKRFMALARQTVDVWNPAQAGRYIDHLREEADETRTAWAEGDATKTVDGLVDSIVVALGALLSLGVDPVEAWGAVHRANMSKVDGSLGETVWRSDGQVGKPHGWVGPEAALERLIRNIQQDTQLQIERCRVP